MKKLIINNCASSSLVSPDHELDYLTRDELIKTIIIEKNNSRFLKNFIFRKYGFCYECDVLCVISRVEDSIILECPSCHVTKFASDDYQHVCCECGQ